MLNIPVSILMGPPTCVPREPISLSHRLGFPRHYYDETKRRNVTDGRTRMAGGAIRGLPDPPAGSGLPDARRPYRGGGRRAGVLAPPQPLRHQRRREPGRMADHGDRADLPRHAALALLAPRGAPGSVRTRANHEP